MVKNKLTGETGEEYPMSSSDAEWHVKLTKPKKDTAWEFWNKIDCVQIEEQVYEGNRGIETSIK